MRSIWKSSLSVSLVNILVHSYHAIKEKAFDCIDYVKLYCLKPGKKVYDLLRKDLKKSKKMSLIKIIIYLKEYKVIVKIHHILSLLQACLKKSKIPSKKPLKRLLRPCL